MIWTGFSPQTTKNLFVFFCRTNKSCSSR